MGESILFNCEGEAAAQAATEAMTRRGLHVVRSFDLRTTQGAHGDCACPHHGTIECTCHYMVLLVYGESGTPAALTIHSRQAQTHLQIIRDANNQPGADLVEKIMAALLQTILQLQTSPSI